MKSTLLSGEGLVAEFGGEGRIWTRTRIQGSSLAWPIPQPTRTPTGSTG